MCPYRRYKLGQRLLLGSGFGPTERQAWDVAYARNNRKSPEELLSILKQIFTDRGKSFDYPSWEELEKAHPR